MILTVSRTHWNRPDRKWTFKRVAALQNDRMYRLYYDFMEHQEPVFLSSNEYPIYNTKGKGFRYIVDGEPTIFDIQYSIENVVGESLRNDEIAALYGVLLAGTKHYIADEPISDATIARILLGAIDAWKVPDPFTLLDFGISHSHGILLTLSKQLERIGIRRSAEDLLPIMRELTENPELAYAKISELRR